MNEAEKDEKASLLFTKEKLREFLKLTTGKEEQLEQSVENIVIRLAELFVDETTQAASYFSYYRGTDKINPEDYLLALKQIHNITDINSYDES